jgi:hypothetical protein
MLFFFVMAMVGDLLSVGVSTEVEYSWKSVKPVKKPIDKK